MSRALGLRPILVLLACLVLASGVAASEAEFAKEYHRRKKEVRGSGKPAEWLRLGDWVESQKEVPERTRKNWLRYTRHQYGVAASKRIKDNDVNGWLDLARTMERLLGSDSVSKSYLRKALRLNPDDARLIAALGKDENGRRDAAGIGFKARKEKADKLATPAAFRELAAWCAGQRAVNKQAEDWYAYAQARELYLSGRGGGSDDPIQKAVNEAEAKQREALRKPKDPRIQVPELLGKRQSKGMTGEEIRNKKMYRLVGGSRVKYSDSLPETNSYESVWKRGRRTSVTPFSDTQVWIQDHPAWWLLKWDAEAKAWVKYTRADYRAAHTKRVAYARDRLARAEKRLSDATKKIDRRPKDMEATRARAEKIAREGGRLRDFTRALRYIVQGASSHHYRKTTRQEAELEVAGWKAKLAELERGP